MAHIAVLTDMLIVLGGALLGAAVVRLLRAPAAVGYLLAGVAVGPAGLGWIEHAELTEFAEISLVLLLFSVGLELTPEPLLRMGHRLFTATGLQLASTTGLAAVAAHSLLGQSWKASIVFGAAVAICSTAIVLRQLSEQREIDTPVGSVTAGVLLLQDVFALLLVAVLPLIGAREAESTGRHGFGAAVALLLMVLAVMVSRWVLPRLIKRTFRRVGSEFSTLFAVVMAAAGAWGAGTLGLSPALGAFVAGLALGFTDVKHQLFAEIASFQGVFQALFFASIGMMLDVPFVFDFALPIGAAIFAVIAAKFLLAAGSVAAVGWPARLCLQVGLGLCTISEFSYAVAMAAQATGILDSFAFNVLTALMIGSMLVGAGLVPQAGRLSGVGARLIYRLSRKSAPAEEARSESSAGHVIIVGYGLNGRNLAMALRASAIPYVVIDLNRALIKQAVDDGGRVIVGDAARDVILERAGLIHARALVICIAETQATRSMVMLARKLRPDLFILARTRFVNEVDLLYRLGASRVIPEEFETSIEVFSHVLKEFGVPDNIIDAQITMVRAGGYAMLRGRPADRAARADIVRWLEESATQTHLIEPGSAADGHTLRELDLRAATGASVIAMVRNGQAATGPAAEAPLRAGDVLVLVGTHAALDAARTLLKPPPSIDPPPQIA